MILIRLDDYKCFYIFKHIILENIQFDIWRSISDKKYIKKIGLFTLFIPIKEIFEGLKINFD